MDRVGGHRPDGIRQLPDADQFTARDVERIIARIRRINNDVIDEAYQNMAGLDTPSIARVVQPMYSYLIGEIVGMCVDLIRQEKRPE